MKGKWLAGVVRRVLDESISIEEALAFGWWRLHQKTSTMRIEGLTFERMDSILWGLIAGIFIGREYTPRGFDIGLHDVVVDIGAHRGVFVGYAANRTDGPILAIEPDVDNFRLLKRFVAKNDLTNVDLKCIAVSDKRGESWLHRSGGSSRHTLLGIDQKTGEELHDRVIVKTVPLHEILDPYPFVHFVKMDCEGAEYKILMSARDEDLDKIQHLVMEVHGLASEEAVDPLMERLKSIFGRVSLKRTSKTLGIIYARKA